jgi:hypothetical protein
MNHQAVIDRLNELTKEQKKVIAEKIVKQIDFKTVLSNNIEKRTKARKMQLMSVLTYSKPYLDSVAKIGSDFLGEKLAKP